MTCSMACRLAAFSMNNPTSTAIYLTEEEALHFVQFQKHYALIRLLESIDAFAMKNGSITIHFDSLGRIALVDKKEQFRP